MQAAAASLLRMRVMGFLDVKKEHAESYHRPRANGKNRKRLCLKSFQSFRPSRTRRPFGPRCALALPAAHDRAGLQRHGKCDESDACVEGRTEVAGLAEDDHGEDDRVDRLEVVGEVDREGRDVLERLDLQNVHEERAEDREDRQIERVGPGRDEGLGRHERDVDGDRHAGEGEAAEQLPAHDGDARVLGADRGRP